jgi:hypothetical protein
MRSFFFFFFFFFYGGAGGNSAFRTSAFEAVCTPTPRLLFLRSSPEALHA